MTNDKAPREKWTMHRWRQLKALERLLIDCESIDCANRILARLPRIIKAANKLRRWNPGSGRTSFFHFLQDQAIADATKPRKRKAATNAK